MKFEFLLITLLLNSQTAGGVTLFDQGSPPFGIRGGPSLLGQNVVTDTFVLQSDSFVTTAGVFLQVLNERIGLLDEASVLFYDRIPHQLADSEIREFTARVESTELQWSLFDGTVGVYFLELSFNEVFIDGGEPFWFGLDTNGIATSFVTSEFTGGGPGTIWVRGSGTNQNGIPTVSWESFEDESLAFSLGGRVVPEPSSLCYLCSGYLAFLRRRRPRKS